MSEFKFACPVCGQHITADTAAAGTKLECPTCFRQIVVPQKSVETDPKFILTAAEVNKPRPTQLLTESTTDRTTPRALTRVPPIALLGLVVAALAFGATIFLFKGKIFKQNGTTPEVNADAATTPAVVKRPAATNTLPWTLDLATTPIPAVPVSGRIRARDFVSDRAIMQNGNLTLRQGSGRTPELGISINLSKPPEQLSGLTISIPTNAPSPPRVILRWREGGQNHTTTYASGYAARIEFGLATANAIPGKIYICLNERDKSCVAGGFVAEIRRPAQKKRPQTR